MYKRSNAKLTRLRLFVRALTAAMLGLTLAFANGVQLAVAADGSGAVLAQIGSHKITKQEVDAKVKAQLYDIRKNALDQMIDKYVLERAANKDNVTVADYVKREIDKKVTADMVGVSAKVDKFYAKNKNKLPMFKGVPAEKAKARMIAALRQRAFMVEHARLLARLRKEAGVKILLQQPRFQVATIGRPALGPKDAPVTMVEFSDFQCPFCKRAEGTLKAIRKKYDDKVRLVFMDFPLTIHNHAMQAASAARCAQEQHKFWQYHDALFADQSKLTPADLKATAKKLGLNTKEFDACFDKGKYDSAIQKDIAEGRKLNVTGTPTFFINGRELTGAKPLSTFEEIIDAELEHAGNHGDNTVAAK